MGDRALVANFDRPRAAADELVALAGRAQLDAVVAVDDQGVLAAAMASERLGLVAQPRRGGRRDPGQGRYAAGCWPRPRRSPSRRFARSASDDDVAAPPPTSGARAW